MFKNQTMDILESLQWRYATKKFDSSVKIEDEKINTLVEAFNLTATSYGLQPIKLIVVKNKELQEHMQTSSFNQEQVSTASHVFVFCIQNKLDENFINSYFDRMENLRPSQKEGVNKYRNLIMDRFKDKPAQQVQLWSTKQAYIALGNLLTVCATLKIDSCPMEGFNIEQIDNLLGLKQKGLSSVLLLPIGIRHKDDATALLAKVRRPIDNMVEFM